MKVIVYWQANVPYRAIPYAENYRAFFVMHKGEQLRVPKYSATVVDVSKFMDEYDRKLVEAMSKVTIQEVWDGGLFVKGLSLDQFHRMGALALLQLEEINENTNRTTQERAERTGLASQCVSGLGEGKPDETSSGRSRD